MECGSSNHHNLMKNIEIIIEDPPRGATGETRNDINRIRSGRICLNITSLALVLVLVINCINIWIYNESQIMRLSTRDLLGYTPEAWLSNTKLNQYKSQGKKLEINLKDGSLIIYQKDGSKQQQIQIAFPKKVKNCQDLTSKYFSKFNVLQTCHEK